jgi:hypothetical protein
VARNTKQGIDYFPLDVQFDDRVELFLLEKEAVGLAVLITLFQIIYQNEGYYTVNGKDLFLLIKKRINVDINEIDSCINVLLERNILHKTLYEKYNILTSSGIQKRFFDAAKRKKEVKTVAEFLLIDAGKYENTQTVNIKEVNVNINKEIVNRNATKEEVEVKGNVKEEVDYLECINTLSSFSDEKAPSNGKCPHQEIINLYHEILPMMPRVQIWPEANMKILRTRWKEEPDRKNLSWWRSYFEYIRESQYLTGKVKDWVADLEWLIRPKNMTKVLNGTYHKQKYGGIRAWLNETENNLQH